MHQPRLATAILAAAILVPASTLACTAAGPKTHIGTMTGADPANGTISIIDAESRQPMTFSAQPDVIQSLLGHKGVVRIDFEGTGSDLTATEVQR